MWLAKLKSPIVATVDEVAVVEPLGLVTVVEFEVCVWLTVVVCPWEAVESLVFWEGVLWSLRPFGLLLSHCLWCLR